MITKKWLKERIEQRDSTIKTIENELIESDKLSAAYHEKCVKLQNELTELKTNYAEAKAYCEAYKQIFGSHPIENTETIYIDGKIYKVSGFVIHHDTNCAETITVDATRITEVVPVQLTF